MDKPIENVVARLAAIKEEKDKIEKEEKSLRSQLFTHIEEEVSGQKYTLPVTTITVPKSFWDSTQMTWDDFLSSRFPMWDLESEKEEEDGGVTFILRKKPLMNSWAYADEYFKLTKSTAEPTPDIDWDTLHSERADVLRKIARPVQAVEIDPEAFQRALDEDPELPSILQRHTLYNRAPSQRVSVRVVE